MSASRSRLHGQGGRRRHALEQRFETLRHHLHVETFARDLQGALPQARAQVRVQRAPERRGQGRDVAVRVPFDYRVE
jgi:hypothetical protein